MKLFIIFIIIIMSVNLTFANQEQAIQSWKSDIKMKLAGLEERKKFCLKHPAQEVGVVESAIRVSERSQNKDQESLVEKIKGGNLSNMNSVSYCDCKFTALKKYYESVQSISDAEAPQAMLASFTQPDRISIDCAAKALP